MLLFNILLRSPFLWDTDPGSGGGGTDPAATPPAATGGEPPVDPPAKTEPVTFTPEQQAYLDKLIGKARNDGRESAKKELEAAQQKAAQETEEKRLKEQAEWQKLAEGHEAKVKELEPQVTTLTEKVTAYEAKIVELLEAKIKALGEAAKAAVDNLPGSPDTLQKLSWLNANEALFKTTPALGPGNQTKIRPGNSVVTRTTPQTPAKRIVRF